MATASAFRIESIEDTKKTPSSNYQRWVEEINLAEKEASDFLQQGHSVYERYKDERKDADGSMRKYNIFSANVGIMVSSLFSKIPKATVSRRFEQSMDDQGRVAAMMIQNILLQDMDDENCNYAQVVRYAILDRLCPGIGCAWLRLETETKEEILEQITDPVTGEILQEAATYERVAGQEVPVDYVHWDDIVISPCRTWEERRWVGRRVFMDRDALVERFGDDKGNKIGLDYKPGSNSTSDNNNPVNDVLQKAVIYEIWDRNNKKVYWVSKKFPSLLDEKEDPLKLENFEPFPRPLFSTQSTDNVIPVSDFVMMQDQYNELDTVNNRISMLVDAVKAVGVYDSSATGVQRMLEEGTDNTLIPVDNWSMFAEKGGIKGQVDWLPLDQVVQALQYLRQAREDIKGQIYELSGISDIVRGESKASETLGAQKIKAQFASVRIQKLQDEVALFAQAILQLKAEIICRHFTPEQILKQSNMEFYLDGQNAPLVHGAIALIKGPTELFEWRVKIQPDSLVQADYQLQKQERVEFINATATFLQSAATMIEREPAMAPMMMEMLKFGVAGFKGSTEVEGSIDKTLAEIQKKIANPAPPPPDPAIEKAKVEMQVSQQEAQLDAQKVQQEMAAKERENMMNIQFAQQMNAMDIRQKQVMDTLERTQKMFDMEMKRRQSEQQLKMQKESADESGESVNE
jgi:hypothetical protein